MICEQCPRRCGVDRDKNPGRCKALSTFKVARAAPHYWEEPCISGENGSGTVFFSGCSLGCIFCQNEEISSKNYGKEVSEKELGEIFDRLIDKGVHNNNLVNPTHYALQLADFLKKYHCPVPVVYNSGGYERVETLAELEGLIDIYLPDLTYISAEKSLKYSHAEDYFQFAAPALLEMRRQIPQDIYDGELMKKGMIVRHLILPKNTKNSIAVLDWLNENLPGTAISLMAQYTPCGSLTDFPELQRKITEREYDKVLDYMEQLGIENAFVQQLDSAQEEFIPLFDLTGV